eukprot:SAG31_NODE_309_length_17949_cov_11.083361_3_plen_260_part_00
MNDYEHSWSKEWPYMGVEVAPAKSAENWCTQGNGTQVVPRAQPCPKGSGSNAPSNCFECLESLPGQYGFPYCAANVSKDESRLSFQLEDQRITASCIAQLDEALASGRSFFVGCGLHKPHVPWHIPFEFRLNFPAVDAIPLPAWGYEPIDMPPVAWHGVADELGDGGQINSHREGYGPGFDADPVVSNLTNWSVPVRTATHANVGQKCTCACRCTRVLRRSLCGHRMVDETRIGRGHFAWRITAPWPIKITTSERSLQN